MPALPENPLPYLRQLEHAPFGRTYWKLAAWSLVPAVVVMAACCVVIPRFVANLAARAVTLSPLVEMIVDGSRVLQRPLGFGVLMIWTLAIPVLPALLIARGPLEISDVRVARYGRRMGLLAVLLGSLIVIPVIFAAAR